WDAVVAKPSTTTLTICRTRGTQLPIRSGSSCSTASVPRSQATFEHVSRGRNASGYPSISAATRLWMTQSWFTPLLRVTFFTHASTFTNAQTVVGYISSAETVRDFSRDSPRTPHLTATSSRNDTAEPAAGGNRRQRQGLALEF